MTLSSLIKLKNSQWNPGESTDWTRFPNHGIGLPLYSSLTMRKSPFILLIPTPHSCVTWDVTETNFGIPIMLHCLNQQYDPLVCQDWSMFISALFTAFQYFCNFTFRTITLWYDNSVSLTTLQMHGYLRIWNMFSKFCFTSQNSPVNRV